MAMQWSFCSHRCVLRAGLGVATLAACVTTTTREFLPSPYNPIYNPAQATPVLAEYLRLQCPAFRKANRADTGTVRFVVSIDTSGRATGAQLAQGSGDRLVDEVFGTVAAQLQFAPDGANPRARREPVAMSYRCVGDSASVVIR